MCGSFATTVFRQKNFRISHTQNQLTWFCSFRRKQQSLAPFSVKLGSGENIPFRRYNAGSAHFGKILLISRNHFAKPVVAKKFAGIDFAKPNIRYRSCLTQVLVSSALGGIMLKIIRCQLRGTEPRTFFSKAYLSLSNDASF